MSPKIIFTSMAVLLGGLAFGSVVALSQPTQELEMVEIPVVETEVRLDEPETPTEVEPEPEPEPETHYTAPKELGYSDEQWAKDMTAFQESGIQSKSDYIAKYNGVCPKNQPDNIFTNEFKYLAAVGADSAYPTPEHFAETAWNDSKFGRGFNPWQVGNFTVLGLPDNGVNRRASLFIDVSTLTAYWEATWEEDRPYLTKVSATYPAEWDELTSRATNRLRQLENLYRSRCL